jgi:hypothetical protein
MRTSSTWPAFAPRTATGPVRMCEPPSFGCTAAWIAVSTSGTLRPDDTGGISGFPPDTVEIVTVSPDSMVTRGFSAPSR